MADEEEFDRERAYSIQRGYLDRAERIYKNIREEAVVYYYDRTPDSEGEAWDYLDSIRKYLKASFDDLNRLLYDIEGELK